MALPAGRFFEIKRFFSAISYRIAPDGDFIDLSGDMVGQPNFGTCRSCKSGKTTFFSTFSPFIFLLFFKFF
jgi:hypothetical protein